MQEPWFEDRRAKGRADIRQEFAAASREFSQAMLRIRRLDTLTHPAQWRWRPYLIVRHLTQLTPRTPESILRRVARGDRYVGRPFALLGVIYESRLTQVWSDLQISDMPALSGLITPEEFFQGRQGLLEFPSVEKMLDAGWVPFKP